MASSAITEVAIANMSLTMLGQQTITALTDTNNRAVMVNQRLADVRDTVLRSHYWNCALLRAVLVKSETAPLWGFANKFALPVGFMRLAFTEDPDVVYRIEEDFIATDADTMRIGYIHQITAVSQWDDTLKQAVAARLAAEVAMPLTGEVGLMDRMWQKYNQVLDTARFEDATESLSLIHI